MKLTKNFSLEEFTTAAGIIIKPTKEQIYCIEVLCQGVLQPIRNRFGPVKVTSGLRDEETYKILRQRGDPVSRTSDHFAWGDVNPRGTGAADIALYRTNIHSVFDWVIDNLDDHFRQVIYYPNKNVIHVANSFSKIFTMPDSIQSQNRIMTYQHNTFVPYSRVRTSLWAKIGDRLLGGGGISEPKFA